MKYSKKTLLCFFALTLAAPIQAGFLSAACITGCGFGCLLLSGPALVGCLKACSWCGAACLGSNTSIAVMESGSIVKKPITHVFEGDQILTHKNGKTVWTKVLKNKKVEGAFEFLKIKAENTEIFVTPGHGMILANHNDELTVDTARNLLVGDRLVNIDGQYLSIARIENTVLSEKYVLETQEGTAIASDFFVTTLCSEEVDDGERLFEPTLNDWRMRHQKLLN